MTDVQFRVICKKLDHANFSLRLIAMLITTLLMIVALS